ncbi:alpha/beta hydrolase [Pseudonocardiaceae bacterium YIM PH 21723]|nr:alpha/beta hydrolase [Pseudonocardiaceae bacterium YIM PH 21723]
MRKWTVLLLAAVMTASAVSPASASPVWGPCPADVDAPGAECSTLAVPLDYRNPGGRTIDIAMSRISSAKPERRRGVLLLNPGGPGGAGQALPAEWLAFGVPQSVRDSYDLIGFDPRGVGRSTPVTCGFGPETYTNIPPYARNAADVADRATRAKELARQCANSPTASIMPFMTTANTARDMDRIREALGESTISYYGRSYGTYLGAVYATLFPRRGDRIVLDSSLHPGGFDLTASRMFGKGFQERFPDFANYLAARPEEGFGGTPEEVTARWNADAAKMDATSAEYGALFRQVTFANLYFDWTFPKLVEAWKALSTGTAPAAAPAAAVDDNYLASQLTVICNDSRWPSTVDTYQRNVAIERIRYPMFGPAGANVWPCAFWPFSQLEPQVKIGDAGPSNVLIVQNRRDPATPWLGAQLMRRALGDRARMMTADAGGHVAYLLHKNRCLNDGVTDYLVDGHRPDRDVWCAAE